MFNVKKMQAGYVEMTFEVSQFSLIIKEGVKPKMKNWESVPITPLRSKKIGLGSKFGFLMSKYFCYLLPSPSMQYGLSFRQRTKFNK